MTFIALLIAFVALFFSGMAIALATAVMSVQRPPLPPRFPYSIDDSDAGGDKPDDGTDDDKPTPRPPWSDLQKVSKN